MASLQNPTGLGSDPPSSLGPGNLLDAHLESDFEKFMATKYCEEAAKAAKERDDRLASFMSTNPTEADMERGKRIIENIYLARMDSVDARFGLEPGTVIQFGRKHLLDDVDSVGAGNDDMENHGDSDDNSQAEKELEDDFYGPDLINIVGAEKIRQVSVGSMHAVAVSVKGVPFSW
jgi:hypothetical protein